MAGGEEPVLQRELSVYETHKREWARSHSGEFVVIFGDNVIGFHSDFEAGFRAGLAVAGLGNNFLLKQVYAEEPVYLVY